jgi:hypothetical protein
MKPTTPKLSEVARHLVIPEGIVGSTFPRVERRLAEVDVAFDPWQRGLGMAALGYREDGKYAASIGGVVASIPRQVGKTYGVGHLLIGLAIEFPDYRVAWTSHHTRTTTNTFRAMQGMVRRKQIYPLLDHSIRSDGIRSANGEQEIRFKNGSMLMFGARERGFGRGLDALDAEVFDEAQILTIKALEDMVPATNQARHEHGGLIFFIGTPPRPSDEGEAFTAKREQAIHGRSNNMVYVEIGADPDSDPDDQSQYPIMNPSFPHRTPLESMLRMRENIPDEDSWNREARGIWPKSLQQRQVIPADVWSGLFDVAVDGNPPDSLGVDMSHRGEISVAACWVNADFAHAEEVWAGVDEAAAIEWIDERTLRRTPIVIDNVSPAAAFIPELKRRGKNVISSSAWDMGKACGLAVARAKAGTVTHGAQDSVTEALKGARKRPIRDAGGWGWDRRDETVNIAPLVAWTLAVFGAVSQRRRTTNAGRVATVS